METDWRRAAGWKLGLTSGMRLPPQHGLSTHAHVSQLRRHLTPVVNSMSSGGSLPWRGGLLATGSNGLPTRTFSETDEDPDEGGDEEELDLDDEETPGALALVDKPPR